MTDDDDRNLVCAVILRLRMTNEEVLTWMRAVKRGREDGKFARVVCTLDGLDTDPRQVWEIPEVRAFFVRLLGLGFPAYLDFTTTLRPAADGMIGGGLGAAEVALIASGGYGPAMLGRFLTSPDFARDTLRAVQRVIDESARAAEAALGPIADAGADQ